MCKINRMDDLKPKTMGIYTRIAQFVIIEAKFQSELMLQLANNKDAT